MSEAQAGILGRRRRPTLAERREARKRLSDEIEKQIAEGKSPQEAQDAALDVLEKEYAAAGLDWATLLPFLMEFIFALLDRFKPKAGV